MSPEQFADHLPDRAQLTTGNKPRIERPMPYIRDSFFAGRDFASLAQMQGEALRWATEVYGRHKYRGLEGQTPGSVFTAIEADALMPLPPRMFESVVYSVGRVAPDCHLKSGKALYSVPEGLLRPPPLEYALNRPGTARK